MDDLKLVFNPEKMEAGDSIFIGKPCKLVFEKMCPDPNNVGFLITFIIENIK